MMAGFEVIVRPVVFPNIRPQAARVLPPEDDASKGICEIIGKGSHPISLSSSTSISASQARPVETERRVELARVYQKSDAGDGGGGGGGGGRINRKNYVDVETANRIKMRDTETGQKGFNGDDWQKSTPGKGFTGDDTPFYYRRQKPADNVEIMERDQIRKNEDDRG